MEDIDVEPGSDSPYLFRQLICSGVQRFPDVHVKGSANVIKIGAVSEE